MSLCLVLNNNNVVNNGLNSTFTYNFIQGGITIPEGSQVCVSNMTIPYSWFNINQQQYNNASFQYSFPNAFGQPVTTINLKNGNYSVNDLNNILQTSLIANNQYLVDANGLNIYYIVFEYNVTFYAVQLVTYAVPHVLANGVTNPNNISLPLVATTPQVIIQNNNFGSIIGYSAGAYPSVPANANQSFLSNIIPNSSPINAVVFRCNLCNNNAITPSDILDSMPINGAFGTNLNYQPPFPKWVKMKSGKYSNMTLSLVDQNLNAIVANDNNCLLTILLKFPDINATTEK